jgi:hypothetical protein
MPTGKSEPEAFRQFLEARYGRGLADASEPGEWSNLGNRLGAIALRLGLLAVDQIDQILVIQENGRTWRQFGEIAVERGFLTPEQLDRVCQIQRIHRLLEAGEQLVVRGQLDVDALIEGLCEFLGLQQARQREREPCFGVVQDA